MVVNLLLLLGCTRDLARPPVLYAQRGTEPWANLPQELQTCDMDVLYATDRSVTCVEGQIRYGSGRSASVGFGSAVVRVGKNLRWVDLVAATTTDHPVVALQLSLAEVRELGRFPVTGQPADMVDDRPVEPALWTQDEQRAIGGLHAELRRRLAQSPRKEVVVYVHGYSNQFDDATFRTAELWHYLGRQFVPILYSWPAGSEAGLVRGYTHDRESSEFTAFHFRQFLLAIAACPEVERIHLVGHSRGTDVVMTALRELKLVLGNDPLTARAKLKLGRVVLAAPDLDWEVGQQRISAERLPFMPERLTIYVSPNDRAIGISQWLFASVRRIGELGQTDLSGEQQRRLRQVDRVELVRVTFRTDFTGHSYFVSNPVVLSDLILLLRDGYKAGEQGGRPLRSAEGGFWELDANYLRARFPTAAK